MSATEAGGSDVYPSLAECWWRRLCMDVPVVLLAWRVDADVAARGL